MTPTREPKKLFGFIRETLPVLLVDDDDRIIEFMKTAVSEQCPVFKLYTAMDSDSAQKILEQPIRFFGVMLDLGIENSHKDQFYLLDKYADKTPFMIYTGKPDFNLAFECGKRGAMAFNLKVEKTVNLVATIKKLCLSELVGIRGNRDINTALGKMASVVFNKEFENIEEMARELGISDTAVRKNWKRALQAAPKDILFLFELYESAFDYYLGKIDGLSDGEALIIGESRYRSLEERYLFHPDNPNKYLDIVRNPVKNDQLGKNGET